MSSDINFTVMYILIPWKCLRKTLYQHTPPPPDLIGLVGRGLIVADIDTFMMRHFAFSSSAMGIVVHFMNRAQMHFQNNFQIIPDIRPTFGDAPHPPPHRGPEQPKM